jgi:DNA-binding LacI/PurR family transcriptional regulator
MMTERFGYESMKTLWSRGPRPDGLFIFPHTAARGSLMALLELGVNIPSDLKLVAHGNIEREKRSERGRIFE